MTLRPSQAEIDDIRADAEQLLTGTCVIRTKTMTFDASQGGHVETWTESAETACNFGPLSGGSSGVAGGRISEETTHVFTLPFDTDIALDSEIVCEGKTWHVTALPDRVNGYLFVRRVEAKEKS